MTSTVLVFQPPLLSPPLPFGLGSADEKLRTVRVGPSVGHGQDARPCMLQDEVFIIEFLAIDGLATSAIMACEVATL